MDTTDSEQPFSLGWWKDMWADAAVKHDRALMVHRYAEATRYGVLAEYIDKRIKRTLLMSNSDRSVNRPKRSAREKGAPKA